MKDIFSVLNEVKNNEDFIEEKLSNEEKEDIFNRVNLKINKRKNKRRSRNLVVAVCGVLVAISFTQTEAFAVLNKTIGKNIESLFAEKDINIESNTKDILQECESNGIKVQLHQAVIEDDVIFASITLDYSNFKKEEHGIDEDLYAELEIYKWNKEENKLYDSFNFEITQNGHKKELTKSEVKEIFNNDTQNKKIEIVLSKKIIDIDTNSDFEINLKADEFIAFLHKSKDSKERLDKVGIKGQWNFNFNINSESGGVNANKVYEINNNLELPYKNNKLKFNLRNVKVSALQVKIHFDVDLFKDEKYDGVTHYKVLDQDGKELKNLGSRGDSTDGVIASYFHNKDLKSIKVVPWIDLNKTTITGDVNKQVEFKDKAIEIDLSE